MDRYYSVSALAKLLGKARETIVKKVDEAGLKPKTGKKNAKLYDISKVAKALYQEPQTETDFVLIDEQARKEHWLANKHEAEAKTEIGELYDREEVTHMARRLADEVVTFFTMLVDDFEDATDATPEQLEQFEKWSDSKRNQIAELFQDA